MGAAIYMQDTSKVYAKYIDMDGREERLFGYQGLVY